MDLSDKLVAERRARLAAERLLELKSRELFAANRKLADHARALSEEIVIQRRVVEDATNTAEELRGENARVRSDLDSATEARSVAEHRLWLALETIRDGFAIYDPAGRLVVANHAWLSVFDGLEEVGPGAHARDILRIGLEEGVFDPEGEDHGLWIERMIDRWRGDHIEPRVIRLWNDRHIRLVDRRGADGGIVSLALDITETIRHEARLSAARQKAEAASRAKSAFLANMSHELRTPMNGVVGMAELLTETALSEEQRLYAETIRSSGESLLHIINDVLDYSKLEAGKLQLRREPFDAEALVHEVARMLTPSAAEKGLSLEVEVAPEVPALVTGDRGRLRQVLTNLVGNAVKFTERGRVAVRVAAAPEAAGETGAPGESGLTIAVEDTGIGIAREMRDHIFGEFNQVEDDRNRKFEGTGLGLSITRRLVALMQGTIGVASEIGAGSCFTVGLPLPAAAPPPPVPAGLGAALSPLLLAAGDAGRRDSMAGRLAALGIAAVGAASGEGPPRAALGDARGLAALSGPLAALPALLVATSPGAARAAAASGTRAAAISLPVPRSEFYAALAALAAAARRAAEAPPHRVAAEAPRRLTILAAEDNRTNQLVFGKMLKDLDVEIAFAGNGREAVEAHGRLAPDMIFMDISMPEMDGKEATRHIRAAETGAGRRTPIVALTAHALAGDEEEILASGLDRYLTKPLKKAAIHAAIAEFFPGTVETGTGETQATGTGG